MLNRLILSVLAAIMAVIIIICPNEALSGAIDWRLKFRTINTEHFAIHYPEALEGQAQHVAGIAEEAHRILSPKYKWAPWGRTQVLFVDSSDSVSDMASVLPYNWIYLRASAPDADSTLAYYDDWLRMVFIHEYTHIMHMDKVGGFWRPVKYIIGKTASPNGVSPGWITEGLGVYEETVNTEAGRGRASYSDMIIRTAILEDKFIPIDEADGVQWRWPSGNTRYIYGVKFLQYLADTYGADRIYEFVDYVASSPLLFEVNRQARRAFSKTEFESEKIHTRYVRQKKEGAPRSKTFYDFWKEWEEGLKKKYEAEKEEISSQGITPFEKVIQEKHGTVTGPAVSPDGSMIAYSVSTPYGPTELRIADIDGMWKKRLLKNVYARQLSFSRDGRYLFYAKPATHKRYKYVYDLFRYDLEKRKAKRLTSGARARDPDVSPDGNEVVCVSQAAGTSRLNIYDINEKKLAEIPVDLPEYTQFSNPRFSPDGSRIAVAVSIPGEIWDIYIFDRNGKVITQVTDDFALDNDPVWGPDGDSLYFVSDRTGISNIYRYSLKGRKTERITNVLTGVFMPVLTPGGEGLFVQYYNGGGYDVRKIRFADIGFARRQAAPGGHAYPSVPQKIYGPGKKGGETDKPAADKAATGDNLYPSKKYSPFGTSVFLPRFIMPNFAFMDDAVVLMAMTGGADPLKRHSWLGSISYRTDAKHFGYSFNYTYARFRPTFSLGVMDYAVDFGNTWPYDANTATWRLIHLYEKRIRGYVGAGYATGRHGFSLQYFYENREPKTRMNNSEKSGYNFGAYAGFNFLYGYNDSKKYEASISSEGGRKVKLGFSSINSIFGSDQKNEQYIFAGDWREYIGLPGRAVWALRAAGGMTWGHELRQGTFSMGGDLGEGTLAGGGSLYYFALRGLPIASMTRSRAMLLSTELRIPLIYAGQGIGTWPVFLNDIHCALFADYGNAWNGVTRTGKYFFDYFLLGVGGEIRGDFVLGHGLPVTGRIGYGIIVVNRDRLGTLTDPILGQSIRNGILILQVGTSF